MHTKEKPSQSDPFDWPFDILRNMKFLYIMKHLDIP